MSVYAHRGQRKTSRVYYRMTLPSLSPNLLLTFKARLAGQRAPGIHPSPPSEFWDLNSALVLAWQTRLLTVPFPHPEERNRKRRGKRDLGGGGPPQSCSLGHLQPRGVQAGQRWRRHRWPPDGNIKGLPHPPSYLVSLHPLGLTSHVTGPPTLSSSQGGTQESLGGLQLSTRIHMCLIHCPGPRTVPSPRHRWTPRPFEMGAQCACIGGQRTA